MGLEEPEPSRIPVGQLNIAVACFKCIKKTKTLPPAMALTYPVVVALVVTIVVVVAVILAVAIYIQCTLPISECPSIPGAASDCSRSVPGAASDCSRSVPVVDMPAERLSVAFCIINLLRSTERRASMENQLQSVPEIAPCHIFSEAVDGSTLDVSHRGPGLMVGSYMFSNGDRLQFKLQSKFSSFEHTDGEVACLLSHLYVICRPEQEDDDVLLVLEDDVYLPVVHLWDEGVDIASIVAKAPDDWGIIKLSSGIPDRKRPYSFETWTECDYSTTSYIIRRTCADDLRRLFYDSDQNGLVLTDLTASMDTLFVADWYIYKAVQTETPYQVYSLNVLQPYNGTEIMTSTLHEDHTDFHLRMFKNCLSNLIDRNYGFSSGDYDNIDFPLSPEPGDSLGLCIPCHYGHLNRLYILLLSVHLQTRLPTVVAVSISSIPEDTDLDALVRSVRALLPQIPTRVKVSRELQLAGRNRNICMDMCSDMDLVSFFDADDSMHPRRLEVLQTIMTQEPSLALLLHTVKISNSPDCNYGNPSTGDAHHGERIYDLHIARSEGTPSFAHAGSFVEHDGLWSYLGNVLANGHATMRTILIAGIRYDDDNRGWEDAHFNRKVLRTLGRKDSTMRFMDFRLAMYFEEESSAKFFEGVRKTVKEAHL